MMRDQSESMLKLEISLFTKLLNADGSRRLNDSVKLSDLAR